MSTVSTKKCSICFNTIGVDSTGWDGGHNAQPVNNGRCCESCNNNLVIKARLMQIVNARNGQIT